MVAFLWSFLEYDSGVSWLTTVLVFVFTFVLIWYLTRRPDDVPPGPLLFPVIGNLPSLIGGNTLVKLDQLRKQYGDIFGLYIGNELTVFLNGYDIIHEALIKRGTLFSHRPMSKTQKLLIKHSSIIFRNGNAWKDHRTFSLKCLRDVCFTNGCRNIEDIIQNELDHLAGAIKETKGPMQLQNYIHASVANVICMVLFRKRFDFDNEHFNKALDNIRANTTEFLSLSVMINCFPFLHALPFDVLGINRQQRRYREVLKLFWPDSQCESSNYKHDHAESVSDLYMNEIDSRTAQSNESSFTEDEMKNTLFEIFGAGEDTTANTIRWVILHLVRNPSIQDNVFQEIKQVIGLGSPPTVQDRQNLPYTEAVILEVMRIALVSPLAIPHSVHRDTVFRGFVLKENCSVIVNLDSCMKDPNIWDSPEEFKPERFLRKDHSTLDVPKEFIPFSAGPRSCLGETIARIENFLFIATLIQKFEFLPEEDGKVPEANGQLGLTWRPGPYLVRVVERNMDSNE